MARMQVVGFMESLEGYLREYCELPNVDWDREGREMMGSFFGEGGVRDGECLEFGAWWGTKRSV